jgi:hypothetical protein
MKIEIIASFKIADGHVSGFKDLEREFKVKHWPNQSSVSVELIKEIASTNIEEAMQYFFEVLDRYRAALVDRKGSLRVAAYFIPEEVAAFSVSLSREVIQLLLAYGMDVEVTGYPCSD